MAAAPDARAMPGAPPATLYVSQRCDVCDGVGEWFRARTLHGLRLAAAEHHPAGLTRLTYEAGDGSTAVGVAALVRGLEHVHLGWALVGFVLRLPAVRPIVQVIADASGAHPRPLPGVRYEASLPKLLKRPCGPLKSEPGPANLDLRVPNREP